MDTKRSVTHTRHDEGEQDEKAGQEKKECQIKRKKCAMFSMCRLI